MCSAKGPCCRVIKADGSCEIYRQFEPIFFFQNKQFDTVEIHCAQLLSYFNTHVQGLHIVVTTHDHVYCTIVM